MIGRTTLCSSVCSQRKIFAMTAKFNHAPRLVMFSMIFVWITSSSFFPLHKTKYVQEPLQTVVLQLKWTHQFQFAGYYAALEKGFYQQAGLDVKIVEGSSSVDPVKEVINGDAAFGIASSDLVIARAKGNPVVSLAAIYQHSPMIILSNPKNGITNVHELAGKSLMLESQNAEILAYLQSEQVRSKRSRSCLIPFPLKILPVGQLMPPPPT